MDEKEAQYAFRHYGTLPRFVSYHHQIAETLALSPESVLEVGIGDGVFKNYLQTNTSVRYQNLDQNMELCPDVVGDVRSIPLGDDCVDVAVAFEVLEHIPFEDVGTALSELVRVARHNVIVSVPDARMHIRSLCKVPLLPECAWAVKLPFARKALTPGGEHYWEIGRRGFPLHAVRALMGKCAPIVKEFVPFHNQYHHFFVLEKADRKS